jgi:hypothetical protein
MFHKILLPLLPILSSFVVSFILAIATLSWVKRKKKLKRNPLTTNLLRAPGETLRKEISKIDAVIDEQIVKIFFVPPMICLISISQFDFEAGKFPFSILFVVGGTLVIFFVIILRSMAKQLLLRTNYQLGLDAELYVGQELNQLMLHGYRVFHDFPEDKNNIDHIIVGPAGVYAIETKGRAKPDKNRGPKDATVYYYGDYLLLPDNKKETAPIQQARKQAASLSKFLSSATGEKVQVKPALAYAGWNMIRKKPDNLTLLYGYTNNYLKTISGKEILSPEEITRIAHQLEQKCRDVEPDAYKKDNK